jgi:hypothetical protein
VFLLQACRGSGTEEAIVLPPPTAMSNPYAVSAAGGAGGPTVVSHDSEMLFALPSAAGHQSFVTLDGSVFVKAFVNALR